MAYSSQLIQQFHSSSRRTAIQYYGYNSGLCASWLVSSASR